METLIAISRWLAKQHVVTCVCSRKGNSGALMPFIFLMRESRLLHFDGRKNAPRADERAQAAVAGTVNGQPKTVALIRVCSLKVRSAGWKVRKATSRAGVQSSLSGCQNAVGPGVGNPLDEIKFTDNTLGFGKKMIWHATQAPSRRNASRLNAGRSSVSGW